MRLTLRTMLAYLDDMLEPEDYQEISKKIEDSEQARGLMNRTRDVIRRLRLGAPKLMGRGMGLDPNTVAEYLDNTMSVERLADFERVCLESDIHLAEVASCHQILTLVLGEPADINPEMRRRMYRVIEGKLPRRTAAESSATVHNGVSGAVASRADGRVDRAAAGTTQAAAAANQGAAVAKSAGARSASPSAAEKLTIPAAQPVARERPQVPDYLREPARSRFWTVAVAVLLAFLLGGALVMLGGPWNENNPIARLFGVGAQPAPVPAGPAAQARHEAPGDTATKVPATGSGANPAESPLNPASPNGAAPSPTAPDNQANSLPPANRAPAAATPAAGSPLGGDPFSNAPPTEAKHPAPPPFNGELPDSGLNPDFLTRPSPLRPLSPARSDLNATKLPLDLGEPVRVGRLLPDAQQVLLRYDDKADAWQRVPQNGAILAGDKLLVLPTFKPMLLLSGGFTLPLLSDTFVEVERPDAEGVPSVRLHYGRMSLLTSGKAGSKLQVKLGDRPPGTILFGDGEPVLAMEVRRYLPPGSDPETQIASVAADLFFVKGAGQITWKDSHGSFDVKQNMRLILSPDPADAPGSEHDFPKWITAEEQPTTLEASASRFLNQSIDEKRPVALTLRELADHRKIEVRALAARCLALIGEFDPFVAIFNDPDQKALWPAHVECLQAALARSPLAAKRVHEAFRKARGEDGDRIFHMLAGYSKVDLENGAANRLVDYLSSDNLDTRVVAFLTLKGITGQSYGYQPQATAAARQASIRNWKDYVKKANFLPKPMDKSPDKAADAAGPAAPKSAAPPAPLP